MIWLSHIKCRGEKTATALENHLNALEDKVDELLAFFEVQCQSRRDASAGTEDQASVEDREKDPKPEQPKR